MGVCITEELRQNYSTQAAVGLVDEDSPGASCRRSEVLRRSFSRPSCRPVLNRSEVSKFALHCNHLAQSMLAICGFCSISRTEQPNQGVGESPVLSPSSQQSHWVHATVLSCELPSQNPRRGRYRHDFSTAVLQEPEMAEVSLPTLSNGAGSFPR